MSIVVSGVTKLYGAQKALNNISFEIKKGEIVGFLGPNGAGKSTTMKILTGYIDAEEGDVFINSAKVDTSSIDSRKITGYLPEGNPLYYDMYVREYLDFTAGIHNITKGKKQRITEMISLTGLQSESNKKLGQLSKGYKQRAGLAAALIHDPEILILDEPTSGLDPNQIIEIREVIRNLGSDKTILFSSHILQEVEAICSRVIIINKGSIVGDDTLENLQNLHVNNSSLLVSFSQPVDIKILQSISSVKQVEEVNTSTFKLFTTSPEDSRRHLIELSLRDNLNIVSLQSNNESLEDIFRNLTKQSVPDQQ